MDLWPLAKATVLVRTIVVLPSQIPPSPHPKKKKEFISPVKFKTLKFLFYHILKVNTNKLLRFFENIHFCLLISDVSLKIMLH